MNISSINRFSRMSRFSISQRLMLLLAVSSLALMLTGAMAFFALSYASHASSELHLKVNQTKQLSDITAELQGGFVDTLNNLNAGKIIWADAEKTVKKTTANLQTDWQALQKKTDSDGDGQWVIPESMTAQFKQVETAINRFLQMSDQQSRATLELFILNDMNALVDPFLKGTGLLTASLASNAQTAFSESEAALAKTRYAGLAIILLSIAASLLLGTAIHRSIARPVAQLAATVEQVQKSNDDARTGLSGEDELGQLGLALDKLLDEKVTTLQKMERENDQLNESIIELLEGTSKLSERDLSVRLRVNEDITGPVADSLNMVTQETSEALAKIQHLSRMVEESALMVNQQGTQVTEVAANEREQVEQTMVKLDRISQNMNQIAKWCQSSNQIARKASTSTEQAFEAVTNTASSMDEIRDSISETEKRIKRLSERSQEISTIVDLINNISERTHVLALNASMQAAAAGEAGRGFAVVADEVQRLAESSRNATSQIGVLVRNIQTETAEAVETMNNSITQVVEGSHRAEQAGQQMKETQSTTTDLVTAVAKISDRSILQAHEVEGLKKQANMIKQSTTTTGNELRLQTLQTQRLQGASQALLETVSVFHIPEDMLAKCRIELPLIDVQTTNEGNTQGFNTLAQTLLETRRAS